MKAVIFDMDGVIVDSEPIFEQHFRSFLIKIGISQPELMSINLKGVGARTTSALLIETFKLEYEVEELVILSREGYLEYLKSLEKLPTIPGVAALIKQLNSNGYRLALASSASAKRIDLFLTKLRLKKYFPVVVCGDDVRQGKPAPDIFLLAAQKLGLQPKDCVVIEDAENGVLAAKSAGMKCIAYAGSAHNTDDLSAADLITKDFRAITKALKHQVLPV